jgi:hypothetical protein
MEFTDFLRDALLGVNTFVEGFKESFSVSIFLSVDFLC